MDFESLRNQVSNLTLYDIKAGVRKVQNAVMNYTEMEAKVREATNNEPWGASSTLMQEIASGTHSYQLLNEIMPMIYKRFTDKTAEEWRQIYKSLQLLEFLVKNGSERVVDDARSHISLLRMLRQFHYIDQDGKDQGINVRNRAQELAKLLSDVDAIRTERKKARTNRNKYGGVQGGATIGGGFSSGGRYGGFGSESGTYGGYQGEVYGDGGGFGGRENDFSDTQRRRDQFEEYDEETEGTAPVRSTTSRRTTTRAATGTAKRESLKAKDPEKDLFDFGDETEAPASTSRVSGGALDDFGALQDSSAAAGDDFDDFQSATIPATISTRPSALGALSPPPAATSTATSATPLAAPQPVAPPNAALQGLFSTTSPSPVTSTVSSPPAQPQPLLQALRASGYQPGGPNYYASIPASINSPPATSTSSTSAKPMFPSSSSTPSYGSSTTAATLGKPELKAAPTSSGDAFGSLWSSASAGVGIQNRSATPTKGPDLASLAKAKSSAGIWGAANSAGSQNTGVLPGQRPGAIAPSPNTATGQHRPTAPLGNGLDDLLG